MVEPKAADYVPDAIVPYPAAKACAELAVFGPVAKAPVPVAFAPLPKAIASVPLVVAPLVAREFSA